MLLARYVDRHGCAQGRTRRAARRADQMAEEHPGPAHRSAGRRRRNREAAAAADWQGWWCRPTARGDRQGLRWSTPPDRLGLFVGQACRRPPPPGVVARQCFAVMLVAAEASGDQLGAGLAAALRATTRRELSFVGVADHGDGGRIDSRSTSPNSSISRTTWEGLKAYPRVVRLADRTAALAVRGRPDVAILIDSWGFNLRVAAPPAPGGRTCCW